MERRVRQQQGHQAACLRAIPWPRAPPPPPSSPARCRRGPPAEGRGQRQHWRMRGGTRVGVQPRRCPLLRLDADGVACAPRLTTVRAHARSAVAAAVAGRQRRRSGGNPSMQRCMARAARAPSGPLRCTMTPSPPAFHDSILLRTGRQARPGPRGSPPITPPGPGPPRRRATAAAARLRVRRG